MSNKWIDLVFLAEAENQGFADTHLITLKGYYHDVVTQRAFNAVLNSSNFSDQDFAQRVEDHTKRMMDAGTVKVREFIDIKNDGIIACLNSDLVDYDFVCNVMDRLTTIELKPETRYEFGQEISFRPSEIPQLNKH